VLASIYPHLLPSSRMHLFGSGKRLHGHCDDA
jgi:hypothetical protein